MNPTPLDQTCIAATSHHPGMVDRARFTAWSSPETDFRVFISPQTMYLTYYHRLVLNMSVQARQAVPASSAETCITTVKKKHEEARRRLKWPEARILHVLFHLNVSDDSDAHVR